MIFLREKLSEVLRLNSIYDFEKINSLLVIDTMSFLDLIFNYNKLSARK